MARNFRLAGTVDSSDISRPKTVPRRLLAGLVVGAAVVGLSTVAPSNAYAAVDTWTAKASMPTGRHYLAAATGLGGRVYAIGGATGGASLTTVEAYDSATGTWAARASMPTARYRLGAATGTDGKVYAI